MSISQTNVLQDLSYLLGEQSVPTTGIDDRKAFIQRALERVYRSYDFELNKVIATISFTGGLGTLSGARLDPDLDIRVKASGQGDDTIFSQVPYENSDQYGAGDQKYWLIPGTDGSYSIYLSDTSQTAATVRFTAVAPIINASISTPFPSSMVLARGALVYQRLADDPQADTSQDEALFQNELQEIIAAENRNRPPRTAKSRQAMQGTYTGDIGFGAPSVLNDSTRGF